MEFLMDLFVFLGSVCIGGTFLWIAYDKLKNWDQTAAYAKAKKLPQLKFFLPLSLGLKIVGGLSVLIGFHAHIGALFLLIDAIPSALMFHSFWAANGTERQVEKALFRKDLAVIGGLLLLLAVGSWSFGG